MKEYKSVTIVYSTDIDRNLNSLASEGYSLHSMMDVPNHFYLFIMERENQ